MEEGDLGGRRRALDAFAAEHGSPAALIARAPGRVNLIGEHTDYNEGFALPIALPHAVWIAVSPVEAATVSLGSEGHTPAVFSLPAARPTARDWSAYAQGMAWALDPGGQATNGWAGSIASDVPVGAGLSSSAALMVAVGVVVSAMGTAAGPEAIAAAAQRVENEIVGKPTGIMDQLISATAVEGHATLIDFRDLSRRPVPLIAGTTVVVLDTTTRRELVDSAYGQRRAACERVAAGLGVSSLRDVEPGQLAGASDIVDPTDLRRARHVIDENRRTVEAAEAMGAGDAAAVGRLMDESHASLRDLFEVSSPALDQIVAAARSAPGCHGARMTGGGFAGCGVALVAEPRVDSFLAATAEAYQRSSGLRARLHLAPPAAGASIDRVA